MQVKLFTLGSLETNGVLLYSEQEAVMVDPGGEAPEVLDYLKEHKLRLTRILNTHLHFDHTGGNQDLFEATGAPIYANARDDYMLQSELGLGGAFGLPRIRLYKHENLDEGQLDLAGEPCSVLATPGHSPGSLSFYLPGLRLVISGDVLFYRSVGRTDFPGGSSSTLKKSIREKLFTLPDNTRVICGHGLETSIGDEKRDNPFV